MPQQDRPDAVIHNSRILSASPDKVFAAFENPDKLATWWGPAGFTNTFGNFEFVPGGNWIFTMHGPNGTDHHNESVFLEIVKDRRIVLEHTVQPWFRLTVALTPDGRGTLLTWNQEFESPEFAAQIREFCGKANEQVLDRLQSLLAGD
ncbi:MAG: polyketide cyclase [Verrucomicrobiaceae bacterium]|nr:MAG: polyketide cyclase [Verrucomicrobiaceae bacterium]